MKILVVGCGSIGKRHAINAASLADTAVIDYDPEIADKVENDYGITSFSNDLEKALVWKPDGVVVSVPHKYHVDVAISAIDAGAHVLIEKPISHSQHEAIKLIEHANKLDKKVFVVCNMRFHPAVQTLRKYLPKIGKPLFSRVHYGNYLPDMRPGIDYRKLYVADPQEGGVVLDGIHEIDYLSWLFGSVESVVSDIGHLSELEMDAEDYSCMILKHKSGARSEVHLDYIRRAKRRGCEITGTDGILDWLSEGKSPEECVVRLYTPENGWEVLLNIPSVDTLEPLAEVIFQFSLALQGKPTDLHTGYEAINVLRTALTVRNGGERRDKQQIL